jgi:hypothetical protein
MGVEEGGRVRAWVHSSESEAGWRAFAKNGFEIVETLTVDLDKYASEPRIVDAKEGRVLLQVHGLYPEVRRRAGAIV